MNDNEKKAQSILADYFGISSESNKVANVFKIYAAVNFVAGFFLCISIELEGAMLLSLAIILVTSFCIYAAGEVIQLLDDIKQNTANNKAVHANSGTNATGNKVSYYAGNGAAASNPAGTSAYTSAGANTGKSNAVAFCPNCGKPVISADQKNCIYCGQPLEQ